jgi:hypothetical protein
VQFQESREVNLAVPDPGVPVPAFDERRDPKTAVTSVWFMSNATSSVGPGGTRLALSHSETGASGSGGGGATSGSRVGSVAGVDPASIGARPGLRRPATKVTAILSDTFSTRPACP